MCLELYAVPAEHGLVSAQRLSRASGLHVEKVSKPVKGAFWFSVDGGCSCSLMAEDADWNEPTWKLQPSVLERLAAAIQLLADEANSFSFQALWAGDRPKSESRVSVRELLRDVRANAVRNGHVYIVGRPAV